MSGQVFPPLRGQFEPKGTSPALHYPVRAARALHLLCTTQFVPQGHFTCFALPSSCRKGTSPALHCEGSLNLLRVFAAIGCS